jgi:serine/threonine protein kinase
MGKDSRQDRQPLHAKASPADSMLRWHTMAPGPSESADWRRIRDILAQALELPASDRPPYLEGACAGDEDLRAELDSLLAASERSAFLDKPPDPLSETQSFSGNVAAAPAAARTQLGRYRLIQKIGQGGMGVVFEATDEDLDRRVALKVIQFSGDAAYARRRFRREARAASALNHPNIVTVYEFGNDQDTDFIAMEFVEGQTLRHSIHEEPAPLARMLGYAQQTALALGHAHSKAVIHRDLKPGNIMVTPGGRVKVLDFGLAKLLGAGSTDGSGDLSKPTPLTQPGGVLGTPAYMSPEQSMGDDTGAASDIFSLGVILFEIACGRRPFESQHAMVTMQEIAFKKAPLLSEFNAAAPAALADLVDRCLNKVPAERPASMEEIAAELGRIRQELEQAPAAAPAPIIEKPTVPRRVAIGLALLVILSGAAIWIRQTPAPIPAQAVQPTMASFQYSIESQVLDGGAGTGPVTIALRESALAANSRFRLVLRSPTPGYFYLVTRGPGPGGIERYWILYPSAKEHSRAVAANEELRTGWLRLDQNAGVEKFWIIWSRQALQEIESVRAQSPLPIESAGTMSTLLDEFANASGEALSPGQTLVRGAASQDVFGRKIEVTRN